MHLNELCSSRLNKSYNPTTGQNFDLVNTLKYITYPENSVSKGIAQDSQLMKCKTDFFEALFN